MNTDFETYSRIWERVLVDIFHWSQLQFLEIRKRYEPHANVPIFYSGGPLQYVVFAVLPAEAQEGGDKTSINQLAWELQDIIEPKGKNCMDQQFDWAAAKDRVRQYYQQKGWKPLSDN